MPKKTALLLAPALALFLLIVLLALPATAQEINPIAEPLEETRQERAPSSPANVLAATHTYTDDTGLTSIDSYSCTSPAILTINVPDNFIVGDVDVGINISHTWRGDVSATLQSPAGTVLTLISDPTIGDESENYDVRVDDVAPGYRDDGDDDDYSAPYYDRAIAPSIPFFNQGSGGGLESFEGQSAQGTWQLSLCDQFTGEEDGELFRWTLFFREPAPEFEHYVVKGAPYRIELGQVFSYTLLVWNTGSTTATATLISDSLPSGVIQNGPASVQLSAGVSQVDFQPSDPVTWLGSVYPSPPYGRVIIVVPVTVTAGAEGTIANTAVITDPALETEITRLAETRVYLPGELYYYEGFNTWATSTGDPTSGPGPEWELSGEWELGVLPNIGPLIGPLTPHSGLSAVGTNPTGPYDDSTTSVMMAVLDLTTVPLTQSITLQWWEWLSVDTRTSGELAFVQIASQDDPTPQLLYGQTSGGLTDEQIAHQHTWFEVVRDITPYQGQIITLTFTLQPNGGDDLVAAGWYVDDVTIRASSDKPAFSGSWKDVTPAIVGQGDTLTYTIYITNSGQAASTNGRMFDQLPPGLAVADASIDGSGILDSGPDWVEWRTASGQSLLPGDDVTITIVASVLASSECGALLSNTSLVTDRLVLDDVAIAANPVPVYPDVYHAWDFELDDGAFVAAGSYVANTWAWGDLITTAHTPPSAHSGTRLWAISGDVSPAPSDHYLTKTMTLPSDPSGVYLEWWDWWDGDGSDASHVYVNTTANTLYSIDADQTAWKRHVVDLTPWANQTVDVVFYYDADGGDAGWYVDDVSIHDGCPYISVGPDQSGGACQGSTATYTLTAHNVSDDGDTIELEQSGNAWPVTITPITLSLDAGETGDFVVKVDVSSSLSDFITDTVQITARVTSTGMIDTAVLTTSSGPRWVAEEPLPVARVEHALIEYGGESYLVSGRDGAGDPITPALKYSPTLGVWTALAPEPVPEIPAANDACFGRDGADNPVIVLFPEPNSTLTNTLHVYDISGDSWSTRTMPAPLPAGGLRGLDIASDRNNNVCYLSGGKNVSDTVGNTLYAYNVQANTAISLPLMTTPRFFHASWIYDGMVCIAGGASELIQALDNTQCYDVDSGIWLAENATLGQLPYTVMGMMNAIKQVDAVQQLWIMGGTASNIALPNARTAHWDSDTGTWTQDAPLLNPVTSGGGDVLMGDVYVAGGFGRAETPIAYHQRYVPCYVKPAYISIGPDQSGNACPGSTASYTLTVYNASDSSDVIELDLAENSWSVDFSPPSLSLGAGETGVFDLSVNVPQQATGFVSDTVRITARATNAGVTDTAVLTTTSGTHWTIEEPLPVARMEHALVEYNGDSYLLSGHDGAGNPITPSLKYSQTLGVWTALAPEPTPEIRAANDACVGLDITGNPIIVLFPQPEYGSLMYDVHVYDVTADAWSTFPVPALMPSGGLWGLDVVSDRANNVCYISGGRDRYDAVQSTLYAYHVDGNTAASLPPMTTARFHHASWLYDGMVCVGGGADGTMAALSSTQCYDVSSGTWLDENATLGQLPYATMGMMDAEKWVGEVQQLWIAGGAESDLTSPHAKTAYWDSVTTAWTLDIPLPKALVLGGGDAQGGDVYVAGGSAGASTPVVHHHRYVQCDEEPSNPPVYLPLVLKD